jgi:hypothetical protein
MAMGLNPVSMKSGKIKVSLIRLEERTRTIS